MSIEAAVFGSLGAAAEQKISKTEKPYLRFNVRSGDGPAATWLSCMVFDKDAIEHADKFTKGARVYVEGRLSLSTWRAGDGTERHGLSVMSWHCRLAQIGRNRPSKRKAAAPQAGAAERDLDDEIPF